MRRRLLDSYRPDGGDQLLFHEGEGGRVTRIDLIFDSQALKRAFELEEKMCCGIQPGSKTRMNGGRVRGGQNEAAIVKCPELVRRDGEVEDHRVGRDKIGRALEPFQSRAKKGLEVVRKEADIPRRVVGIVGTTQEDVVVGRGGIPKHNEQHIEHRDQVRGLWMSPWPVPRSGSKANC